jgi:signal transduction histidine kinase
MAELEKSRQELRALLVRLEHVREEEHTRIARDIHDDFGQKLTALKMDLRQIEHVVRKAGFSGPRAEVLERAAGAIELVDSAQTMVQEIAATLRPGILDRLGLGPALQYEARRFQQRAGIPCATVVCDPLPALPPRVVTALFRIFQECLTNVARHAQAGQVLAELAAADETVCLRVRDDGIGIPPDTLTRSTSLGLLGIRERVAALDGEVVFQRGAQGGTVVEVRLPLQAPPQKRKRKPA